MTERTNAIWLHRYSAASIALAVAQLVATFLATSHSFPGTPFAPHSRLFRELALLDAALACVAIGLATLALAKEQPKGFAIAAVGLSVASLLICTLRMAV
jgi:hypothetical protein